MVCMTDVAHNGSCKSTDCHTGKCVRLQDVQFQSCTHATSFSIQAESKEIINQAIRARHNCVQVRIMSQHGCIADLHCVVYLVCFCLLNSGVVCTLPNQQGNFNLVCMVKGADSFVQLLVILNIAHSVHQLLLHWSPVRRNRLEQGADMRRPNNVHTTAASKMFRMLKAC